MKLGKVPETILKRSVFKQLSTRRKEVLVRPHVGEDCSVLQFESDEVCVVSTDPITAALEDIGSLAVHITANDLASSGAEPVGILLTILLPEGFMEEELRKIMQDINGVCETLHIEVIGGHTEVTNAVNKPVISVTGIGKAPKEQLVLTGTAKPGQDIILTKWAGLEGTAIIAKDHEDVLSKHFNRELMDEAIALGNHLSVVEEARVAMKHGVSSMHDVTEGGVFGALWELGACSNVGLEVVLDDIPVKQCTIEICEYYGINPYKLISSGCMLMTADDGNGLIEQLQKSGIHATIIGKIMASKNRIVIQSDTRRALTPPKTDELYKVMGKS
ncbi:hydrogenase maturation factor [Vallitalea pronyensis]|uniref:Hydrogenase maturation factor n=1 Tax=Vallitalea pronyensis TaxID=1348613 RepID=A0A8J8MQA3_9FIRM|nr:AIR synthase family protein [Vallitalea pronyensis]QUI25473.1 hydrogenase maturation factor [Vallitalea pronyensis]